MSGVLLASIGRAANSLAVTASPDALLGFSFSGSPATVTTSAPTTVSVSGGTPPYTYVWSRISGDTSTYATGGSSPSTYFGAYFVSNGEKSSVWKCTVTDFLGTVQDSNPVAVFLSTGFIV